MLMPHKFGANASNLVLMPKKTGGGGHYNFFFYFLFFIFLFLFWFARGSPYIVLLAFS
jgi:hypothetical protein